MSVPDITQQIPGVSTGYRLVQNAVLGRAAILYPGIQAPLISRPKYALAADFCGTTGPVSTGHA
eukprot:3413892-Rhodomonas_salina.1